MKKLGLAFICTAGLMASGIANATFISGVGTTTDHAALTGGTVLDFESTALGTYSSITLGDITFTGVDGHLMIDNSYQQYNQTGIYLDNGTYSNNGFGTLNIDISGTTDAFGFTWGMAEVWATWTLSAYDAANNLIESYVLPSTGSGSAGNYYGISAAGIASATLSWSGNYDWVAIDNFTYLASSVPEPSVLFLMGAGLMGIGAARRMKSKA